MKFCIKTIVALLLLAAVFQNMANAQHIIDLSYWESTQDKVFSWYDVPSVSVTKLNNNGSFNLQNYFNHAKAEWNDAGIESQQIQFLGDNANIVCYGGYLAELRTRTGIFIESNDCGVTAITSGGIYNQNITFSYNGQTKYHYKISKSIVCIVDRNCGEDQLKSTFTHEYGHALGWYGHSQAQYYYYYGPQNNMANVMYAYSSGTIKLSPADKRHLRQFY